MHPLTRSLVTTHSWRLVELDSCRKCVLAIQEFKREFRLKATCPGQIVSFLEKVTGVSAG